MSHITLGDLKKSISKFSEEYDEVPLVYFTDDEGNECCALSFVPSLMKVKKMSDRGIETGKNIKEISSEELSKLIKEDKIALCLN